MGALEERTFFEQGWSFLWHCFSRFYCAWEWRMDGKEGEAM